MDSYRYFHRKISSTTFIHKFNKYGQLSGYRRGCRYLLQSIIHNQAQKNGFSRWEKPFFRHINRLSLPSRTWSIMIFIMNHSVVNTLVW